MKRACVGPDGIDQRGGAGFISLLKRSRPHFAKRTSIGANEPAGTLYQSTPSYETVHAVELLSTIVRAAGVAADCEEVSTRAHPATAIATKAKLHQGRFMKTKLDYAARFLLHHARIIAVW
jgi:hypothetical protein